MATVRLPLPRLAARGLDYGNAAEQRT
jgi:hypothetical protein